MRIIKCDICGKDFTFGFSVETNLQGENDFTNIAKYRDDVCQMDVCTDCFYKIKKHILDSNYAD